MQLGIFQETNQTNRTMNTPTPETDEWIKNSGLHAAIEYAIWHMRNLELQRDNLQKTVDGLCEHFHVTPANSTLLVVELLRMKRELNSRDRMAEILRDILAYHKGDKPHDYWALQNQAEANTMAFDAWQEILRKIEHALETEP